MRYLRAVLQDLKTEWGLPWRARRERSRDYKGLKGLDPGAEAVANACVHWLGVAQDSSKSADGGVARHFSLIDGWSTSYPETTGYIVETMINHANRSGHHSGVERAWTCPGWVDGLFSTRQHVLS